MYQEHIHVSDPQTTECKPTNANTRRRVTLSPPYPHPYSVTSPPPRPVVGAYISVLVRMPPDLSEPTLLTRGDAFARITMLDKVYYRAVFEMAGLPRWFLHSERWQWLEEVEVEVPINYGEGSGSVMCKKKMVRYQTIEVFYGLAAYVMNFFMGSKLKVGFQAAADALKQRAEKSSIEA